jgi:ABC-type amino acid transport substrate-binding protein
LFAVGLSLLSGYNNKDNEKNVMKFMDCANYQPFEYYKSGEIFGFDIDLVKSVAKPTRQ